MGETGLVLLAFGLVAFGRRVADRIPTFGTEWRDDGGRVVILSVERVVPVGTSSALP